MRRDPSGWDRAADLAQIEATYAGYDASGRSRLWRGDNQGYARLAGQVRHRLLADLARSIGGGRNRVLDLGCGTGDLALEAADAGLRPDWVGVDLRTEAVDAARAAFPTGTFIAASADDVPEPTASFDVVVAQVLFSSLPSESLESAVAAEIGRLLKPSGWLVWSDLRYSNPRNPAIHGLDLGRIRRLFPGWHREIRPMGLLPPIARGLGPAAGLLYPVLSAIGPLRSHLVGRLRHP